MLSATKQEDMPQSAHWGIFEFSVVNVYEESYDSNKGSYVNQNVVIYTVFLLRKDWEKQIDNLTRRGNKFHAVQVSAPAKISIKTIVEIN